MPPTTEPVLTARAGSSAPGWVLDRVAALTFDDGPSTATGSLLDVLGEYGVPATFCVVGAQVLAPGGAEVLRRTVAEGHRLAVHGMTYDDMGRWEPARVRADLVATVAAVRGALGDPSASVPWFRAPNGSWGQTAAVAAGLGLQPLGVTGTIDDWRTQDVPTLCANLRAAIRPGGIVLAHDGGGDQRGTVEAVRVVLPEWLGNGWTFTVPAHPDLDPPRTG